MTQQTKEDQAYPYKIARKSDVWDMLERGILFNAYYDTEATDLDKRFAEITQFGGVITDVAGNILHIADIRGKPSEYGVISPYAWLVQRMRAEDLEAGLPQYLLAGRIMQFFRWASDLHEAPYAQQLIERCRPGVYSNGNDTRDIYFSYPLLNDDGTVDWDCLRIHDNMKKFYLKQASGVWVKKLISAQATGYNNVHADDQWLWTLLHMAAVDNIFITHLPKSGKYRLDMLRVVESAVMAGPKGENGVQPGQAVHPETKQITPSFRLGDVLAANTRHPDKLRGITEGIVMPDGSYPDVTQLHGALKDSLAVLALHEYIRRAAPRMLREMEGNTDWKKNVERLAEKKGGIGHHPIHAYIDKTYPNLTGSMVTLIGTDQQRHNPKTALVFNLDVNPETFRYNGKTLKELSPQDHASLIRSSRDYPRGIYKIIRTHHSPRLFSADLGFAAGFNNGLDLRDLQKRAKYFRDPVLTERAMAGLRIAAPRLNGPDYMMLPQPEEELFTFSTLEMRDVQSGDDVQIHMVRNRLERLAQDSRRRIIQLKTLWLRAIGPDEDILLDDAAAPDAADYARLISKFFLKIKDINKKLTDYKGPKLPAPDGRVRSRADALQYKIKLLFSARNLFATGQLQDIGHHFWFEDKKGQKYDEADLKKWPEWRIDAAYHSGDLIIRHEHINVTAHIIDRILESLGAAHLLGPEINEQLQAVKNLRRHGLPLLGPEGNRWTTIARAKRDVQRLLNNELQDADMKVLDKRIPGQWNVFLTKNPEAQAALHEYIDDYLRPLEEKTGPFIARQQELCGLNPETGAPFEAIDYLLDPDKTIKVMVPDKMLKKPPLHPVTGKPLWLISLKNEFNRLKFPQGGSVVLVGQYTGKTVHLAAAKTETPPEEAGMFVDFYRAARALYSNSGVAFPESNQRLALSGEGPYPVHGARPIQAKAQTLHVPSSHLTGLMNYSLGSYAYPVSGMILRDDALRLKPGRARLLEVDDKTKIPTGWEISCSIKSCKKMALDEIEALSEEEIHAYGFASLEDLQTKLRTFYADKRQDPKNPDMALWVVDFGSLQPHHKLYGTTYYNPQQRMISAMKTTLPINYATVLALEDPDSAAHHEP